MQERQIADNQAGGIYFAAFGVFAVGAGVADVRVGQGNDLPAVGWVGKDFLIAGHRGVEHDFAGGRTRMADRDAAKDAAVGKNENGGGGHGWLL